MSILHPNSRSGARSTKSVGKTFGRTGERAGVALVALIGLAAAACGNSSGVHVVGEPGSTPPSAAGSAAPAGGNTASIRSGEQSASSFAAGPGPSAPALDSQTVTELENELDQLDNSLNEASSDLQNP